MKLKFFKRIIVFGVLLTFVALCAAGFAGCKSCDGGGGDDGPGDDPVVDPPTQTETDPTKIGYYDLPDSFVLSLSAGDESFNYVKFDGGYYADSARSGGLLTRKHLKKTGDSYAYYESSYVDGEFVWGEPQTLTAEEGAKRAVIMFSFVLEKPEGETLPDSISVQGTAHQCRRIEMSSAVGSMTFFVIKDYDFWIKSVSAVTSGNTITTEATFLSLGIAALPDFVSLPA